MARKKSGDFDRRIQIQVAVPSLDAAGADVITWSDDQKLWAKKREMGAGQGEGASQVLRDGGTMWTVRYTEYSATIGPETHRIIHMRTGRIYEITGLSESEGDEREDTVRILSAYRPDQRGASAPSG